MSNIDFSSFEAFLDSLKLGAVSGLEAFILIISLIVLAVMLIVVLIANGVKAIKEQKDAIEDKQEKDFYAEYGVSPEELRLNQKIANLRVVKKKTPTVKSRVLFTNEDNSNKFAATNDDLSRIPQENIISNVVAENINVDSTGVEGLEDSKAEVETNDIAAGLVNSNVETNNDLFGQEQDLTTQALDIADAPAADSNMNNDFDMNAAFGIVPDAPIPEVVADPIPEPIPEIAPEPVPEVVPEVVPEPVVEPTPEIIPEPVPEPVIEPQMEQAPAEEPKQEESAPEGPKKFLKKKGESWLKYEGEFNGYYYDPVDAYYYKGKPTTSIEERNNEFKEFFASKSAENAEKIIPKDALPSFVEIGTPKVERPALNPIDPSDEAATSGQYLMGNTNGEYYFTLYSPTGSIIYESGNFASPEFATQALKLFKKHQNTGVTALVKTKGKFCYILKAKGIKYTGVHYDTQDEASKALDDLKNFGHTGVIREG